LKNYQTKQNTILMKLTKIFMLTAFVSIMAGFAVAQTHKSALLQYDKQIDGILSQMTLEEKVNMLHAKHMFISAGVERLGIADMIYVDGPFGIREEMQPDGWAGLGWENDKATFFPTGSALGSYLEPRTGI
jgi:beta-glucosidase